MIRLAAVLATVLVVAGLTLAHLPLPALIVGMVIGLYFFLRGMSAGGSLGNARQFGKKPADMNARIGTCLAAMGIAASAIGSANFPLPFRVFYGLCLGVASVGAVVLAWKGSKS